MSLNVFNWEVFLLKYLNTYCSFIRFHNKLIHVSSGVLFNNKTENIDNVSVCTIAAHLDKNEKQA